MDRRTLRVLAVLVAGVAAQLRAVDAVMPPPPVTLDVASAPSAGIDEASRTKIELKAARIVESLKLEDADKTAKVKSTVSEWLGVMMNWHNDHDAELGRLWGEWNKARSVVPKDEFPGEVVAHRIDDVYASLRPAYEDYIRRLSAELMAEQVDAIKENWSRSPGMTRTYNAYLEIVPDLTEKDKEVIKARLLLAREAAMLTDSDKEIVAIYKRHKVKVEQYVGTLQWAKLHKAFAERGKGAGNDEKSEKKTADPATTRSGSR
jgi:hypothetical protein